MSLEAFIAELRFDAAGLVPVIVQDHTTGEVLMMAWTDEAGLRETIASGRMVYWSRSRQAPWRKGDTSGHVQYLRALAIDCDGDTLLAKVDQVGAACHTGARSCFFRPLEAGVRDAF